MKLSTASARISAGAPKAPSTPARAARPWKAATPRAKASTCAAVSLPAFATRSSRASCGKRRIFTA